MKNNIIIGYDLNDEYVQISYLNDKMITPDIVYLTEEQDKVKLPVTIEIERETNKLTAGVIVSKNSKNKIVNNLFKNAINDESVEFNGIKYSYKDLFFEFFKQSMSKILEIFNSMDITISFTLPSIDNNYIFFLKSICRKFNIKENNIYIQDYKESFYNYIVYNYNKSFNYDIVLFTTEKNIIYSYVLNFKFLSTAKNLKLVNINKIEIGNIEKNSNGDKIFKEKVENIFKKRLISIVFFIGDYFNDIWYINTKNYVCVRRKVFKGNFLFSTGACFSVINKCNNKKTNIVYFDENKITFQIELFLKKNGKDMWYPIVLFGENWYEINKNIEILINNVKELKLKVNNFNEFLYKDIKIDLTELFLKQNKINKLKINIQFLSKKICKLKIEDVDFGNIVKKTGFYKEYNLSFN